MIVVFSFQLCMKLINVLIVSQLTIKTLYCILDPTTRQTFEYASPISCNNVPQKVVPFHPEYDDFCVWTHNSVLRATPTLVETKQSQPALGPQIFTAQESGKYSNAQRTIFRNRVLFTKYSDTTLKLLGKCERFDFLNCFRKTSTRFFFKQR